MKKNSQNPLKIDQSLSLFDADSHPIVQWIMNHGQNLIYSIVGVFAVLFLLYFWFAMGASKTEDLYKRAQEEFSILQLPVSEITQTQQEVAFKDLLAMMQEQPDLHAKYDAQLAQLLIERNEVSQAEPLAKATFQRVSKDSLPFYLDYAKISLLIAENKFQDAVESSLRLKENMLKQLESASSAEQLTLSFGDFLFAFNLLRIPFLQQHIGADLEELQSWKTWQEFSSLKAFDENLINKKAFFAINQLFSSGNLTLNKYIEERLQILSSLHEIK